MRTATLDRFKNWTTEIVEELSRKRWAVTSTFRKNATHHDQHMAVDALPLGAIQLSLETGFLPDVGGIIATAKEVAHKIKSTSFVIEDDHVHFFFYDGGPSIQVIWQEAVNYNSTHAISLQGEPIS